MRRTYLRHALASVSGIILALGLVNACAAELTDQQVRELIVAQSLRSYPGNCPCPYNVDRAGRQCGKRSAWSKPGGYSPICFVTEVSEAQVRAFRSRGASS